MAYCDMKGIIPAYAGNTSHADIPYYITRDHPRVCGEHMQTLMLELAQSGSSPRMRGTPNHWSRADTLLQDHPRVCGEHARFLFAIIIGSGSSPRMRGTRCLRCRLRRRLGIIPAYAGNTHRHRRPQQRSRDHPRVCGEHQRNQVRNFCTRGSSPRMRGTLSSRCCRWPA